MRGTCQYKFEQIQIQNKKVFELVIKVQIGNSVTYPICSVLKKTFKSYMQPEYHYSKYVSTFYINPVW